jgi:hypothetical protein
MLRWRPVRGVISSYHGEGINDRDMEKTFLLRLSGEESLYSLYFGLDNDDFFQVINTGGNPGLAASLAAPPETRFAPKSHLSNTGRKAH